MDSVGRLPSRKNSTPGSAMSQADFLRSRSAAGNFSNPVISSGNGTRPGRSFIILFSFLSFSFLNQHSSKAAVPRPLMICGQWLCQRVKAFLLKLDVSRSWGPRGSIQCPYYFHDLGVLHRWMLGKLDKKTNYYSKISQPLTE